MMRFDGDADAAVDDAPARETQHSRRCLAFEVALRLDTRGRRREDVVLLSNECSRKEELNRPTGLPATRRPATDCSKLGALLLQRGAIRLLKWLVARRAKGAEHVVERVHVLVAPFRRGNDRCMRSSDRRPATDKS